MQAFINHIVKKYPYSPHGKDWKFKDSVAVEGGVGGGGGGAVSSKGKYEANNFQGVGGTVEKINSLEGVVIIERSTK